MHKESWCATKLDEDNGDIEEYGTCIEESENLCQTTGTRGIYKCRFIGFKFCLNKYFQNVIEIQSVKN